MIRLDDVEAQPCHSFFNLSEEYGETCHINGNFWGGEVDGVIARGFNGVICTSSLTECAPHPNSVHVAGT